MNRRYHSKSALFLMELLLNLLLFCFLCACGLQFFIKSRNLIDDATTLHNAVRITSSIAAIYEDGDGSFTPLCEIFEHTEVVGNSLYIYFDKTYQPCGKDLSVFYVLVRQADTAPNKIRIDFYDSNGDICYSINACNYIPFTLQTAKEVAVP